jgi:undecaprenyl-diphosphatase
MNSLIVFIGQYVIFIVGLIALAVTVFSEKTVRNKIIMLVIPSYLIAFGIASLAGTLYYNPRPFTLEHTIPLIPHLADNGFPSDHTLYAMVASAAMFLYRRRIGILLGILAVLVGVCRVIAEIHQPIDIVGGVAIAITATCIAWVILRLIPKLKLAPF